MRQDKGEKFLFSFDKLLNKQVIGDGATAVVHAGSWKGLDVAVKVYRGENNHHAKQEANRERKVLQQLNHPNIIRMLGVASVEGGGHANVLEYHSGGVLDVKKIGGFSDNPLEVLTIAIDVARALDYAHSFGILHRDVKVSQILLDCCGHAILNDWGLSCKVGEQETTVKKTGTYEVRK